MLYVMFRNFERTCICSAMEHCRLSNFKTPREHFTRRDKKIKIICGTTGSGTKKILYKILHYSNADCFFYHCFFSLVPTLVFVYFCCCCCCCCCCSGFANQTNLMHFQCSLLFSHCLRSCSLLYYACPYRCCCHH